MTNAPPPRDPPEHPPGESPSDAVGPAESGTWSQVHELFHQALVLDAEARAAFLLLLGSSQPERAVEVRSLLEAHAASTGFLAQPPGFRPARTVFPDDRLGPYRVLQEIGHGGMGVVYRARRDDESFTKDVAIKLIDPGLRSGPILQRFRDERQILAMLEHPHIARLLDGGTAPDGTPYLVMEYVEGRSLLEDCDARGLGVRERLELFLQVCDAVQFAHQRLVVHRDLKSDNVLVTAEGSPRLLDFGIAKLLAAEGDGAAATLTAPMNRPLTPDYASPEQIRGEPAAVAGDVYSLGVILYELLTGVRPLRFTTRNPEEILRLARLEEPRPPSSAVTQAEGDPAARRGTSLRHLRRLLAGDLDFITLQALEKSVARRYATVDQLAWDIRRYLRGRPVLARGRSTAYRMSRFVRRHRAAVITTALVTAALVTGLVGTTWQARVARIERDRANRRFEDVKSLARAVVFDLHDAIVNLPGSTRARELLVSHALRYLDRLRGEAEGNLGLQRELGVAYAKIADVQGRPMFPNLGQSGPALKSYDKAIALLAAVSRAWPESLLVARDLVVVEMRKSDLLRALGRPEDSIALMLAAKARLLSELVHHPGDTLLVHDLGVARDRLFDLKLAARDTSGAVAELREGRDGIGPLFSANPRNAVSRRGTLITLAKLGEVYAARGERDSALACYLHAEKLASEGVDALPNDTEASRDLSIVYGMLGIYLAQRGPLDSALAVYGRGMRISEELAAADPANALAQSDVAQGHFEIGNMLHGAGRFTAAVAEFGEASARFARLAVADSANVSHRLWEASSCRKAAEACRAAQQHARTPGERARWRAAAAGWLDRALARYSALERRGALSGDEVSAPSELRAQRAALRSGR